LRKEDNVFVKHYPYWIVVRREPRVSIPPRLKQLPLVRAFLGALAQRVEEEQFSDLGELQRTLQRYEYHDADVYEVAGPGAQRHRVQRHEILRRDQR
jgi:hypothetical protein